MRRALKSYLRWRIGSARALKLTDWLDTRDRFKTPDFLKEREIEKLYKGCHSAEERFLVAVLFDSGARASEFHNIRFEDVELPEGRTNFVKLTLKEEYSKTKGRTISLFWRQTLEAVQDYLRERDADGIRSTEPFFRLRYAGARMFLHRLGKRILGRSIHYHLFRHRSATYYADKLNRQQLCIRYGWAFSSRMPDVYIARAGVDTQELDVKFASTEIEKFKTTLTRVEQEARIKDERIKHLERTVAAMERNFPRIVQLLEEHGSVTEIRKAIDEKQRSKDLVAWDRRSTRAEAGPERQRPVASPPSCFAASSRPQFDFRQGRISFLSPISRCPRCAGWRATRAGMGRLVDRQRMNLAPAPVKGQLECRRWLRCFATIPSPRRLWG